MYSLAIPSVCFVRNNCHTSQGGEEIFIAIVILNSSFSNNRLRESRGEERREISFGYYLFGQVKNKVKRGTRNRYLPPYVIYRFRASRSARRIKIAWRDRARISARSGDFFCSDFFNISFLALVSPSSPISAGISRGTAPCRICVSVVLRARFCVTREEDVGNLARHARKPRSRFRGIVKAG